MSSSPSSTESRKEKALRSPFEVVRFEDITIVPVDLEKNSKNKCSVSLVSGNPKRLVWLAGSYWVCSSDWWTTSHIKTLCNTNICDSFSNEEKLGFKTLWGWFLLSFSLTDRFYVQASIKLPYLLRAGRVFEMFYMINPGYLIYIFELWARRPGLYWKELCFTFSAHSNSLVFTI